jgi:hypothetical protein
VLAAGLRRVSRRLLHVKLKGHTYWVMFHIYFSWRLSFGISCPREPRRRKITANQSTQLTTNRRDALHLTAGPAPMTSSHHIYEVRPRKDKRGVDLISVVLPFARLWYGGPDAIANAIGYAKF